MIFGRAGFYLSLDNASEYIVVSCWGDAMTQRNKGRSQNRFTLAFVIYQFAAYRVATHNILLVAMCWLLMAAPAARAAAQVSVGKFYHGKQIELVIGFSPGGTYDLYARLLARHLGEHIPGRPTIIPTNMPGAGSRTAAAYIYSVAQRDVTVIGTADEALALEQATEATPSQIDVSKLEYIGNPIADNNTTVTWAASGIKSIEDAESKTTPVGATGANASSEFPLAMNAVLGTKFKIIYGYPGDNDIIVAMERGEVAGVGSDAWSAWKTTHPDWLRDKKINILVQIGLKKAADLPDVPLLIDLAKNSDQRAILTLLSTPSVIGRAIFAPPGVPEDRMAALRQAFDETVRDPAFIADAKQAHAFINPVSGQDVQNQVQAIVDAPPSAIKQLAAIFNQAGDGSTK
jgi:tripartite-type tricarboxylate transporter receptor subunit TctC